MFRTRFLCLFGAALAALAVAAPALGDVKITDRAYVTHEGGTDPTTVACSTNNRQQNEPAAAVSPTQPNKMTAGANDYCTTPTNGDAWAGFYYSSDSGANWTNSLLPGYPNDATAEGAASPLHGLALAAGDPVQAWDRFGNVYYGGIAFNRGRPANGSIWVARYSWIAGAMPDYQHTAIVSRGTPSPIFLGLFHDKVMIEVDRSETPPRPATSTSAGRSSPPAGRTTASSSPARPTAAGRSRTGRRSPTPCTGTSRATSRVGSTGRVWVAWRQFEFKPNQGQRQKDAIAYVYSTDGGRSFTKPALATEFIHWDMGDTAGDPAAFGRAGYEACLAGDGTLGRCESPEPKVDSRDCGDGPFECKSGYVFGRADSSVHISADPTPGADPDAAYALVDATVPGTETPTGTSYSTVTDGVGSQASTYLVKTTEWRRRAGRLAGEPAAEGSPVLQRHRRLRRQAARRLPRHAQRHRDRASRHGGATSARSRSRTSGSVVLSARRTRTRVSRRGTRRSIDGGANWTHLKVSSVSYALNHEQFGNRDIPFFGDYNYISATASNVLMAWPSGQDTLLGPDPRYTDGNGTDGFDVHQCRVFANGAWGADTCADAGGLDQNIYGFVGGP